MNGPFNQYKNSINKAFRIRTVKNKSERTFQEKRNQANDVRVYFLFNIKCYVSAFLQNSELSMKFQVNHKNDEAWNRLGTI